MLKEVPSWWKFEESLTGLFRVRVIIHPPGISLLDGPIQKPFEVVIVHSHWFCLVYLDGLHVGNYPSKICNPFWTCFGTLEIWCWSSVLIGGTGLLSTDPISYSDIVWSENPLKMTIFLSQKGSHAENLAYSDIFSGRIGGIFLSVLKSV